MKSTRAALLVGAVEAAPHLGLLVLRVGLAGMMLLAHGWPKVLAFGEKASVFPDPLGVGSAASMTLAIFAEVVCSVLVLVGLATRFAAGPLLVTMLVAAFVVHADDPWQKKELALVYAIPFATLMLTGAGRWSVDALWAARPASRKQA